MKSKLAGLAALASLLAAAPAWACLVPTAAGGLTACPPCGGEAVEAADLHDTIDLVPDTSSFNAASVRSGGLPGGENVVTVHVLNFDYSINTTGPAVDAVISAGDTVHWVFDTAFHSVTSAAGSSEVYDSGVFFSAGATFDRTFNSPGTYQYYCSIHGFDAGGGTAGGMSGIITVRAVPEPVCALLPLVMLRRRR